MTPNQSAFKSDQSRRMYLERYEAHARRWPVPCTTEMIDTAFGQTFVRISGPPSGSPLVVVHGASANSLIWSHCVARLAERYRVFALDNIFDYGRSVCTQFPDTIDELCTWLDEVLEGLHLAQGVHLAGHSYGAWISSLYAARHPERLQTLTLIAPAYTLAPFSVSWISHAALVAIPLKTLHTHLYFWLLEDFAKSSREAHDEVNDLSEEVWLASHTFTSRHYVPPTLVDDEELRKIRVPTLLMMGEHEKVCDPKKAIQRLHDLMPQAEAELIPATGHDVILGQPDALDARWLRFLDAHAVHH
ncbi:alpha/beta hydrolase [Polyangium sp. y55x31]|uniref:alpha/beta fold hydrolase n=1 Tax=Polyangium sp. y55x31 TaxID=3042688 RepID=UPI00248227BC|nr:alpha/beta hydrolase [Polyangium sp. y55x31]MDI1475019.1 alpha/beta hydrolase [Polyangium sp. y55x31]